MLRRSGATAASASLEEVARAAAEGVGGGVASGSALGATEQEFMHQLREAIADHSSASVRYVLSKGDVNKHFAIAAGVAVELVDELGGVSDERGPRLCTLALRLENQPKFEAACKWALKQFLASPSPYTYSQWKAAIWGALFCSQDHFAKLEKCVDDEAWQPRGVNESLVDDTMPLFNAIYTAQFYDPFDVVAAPSMTASEAITLVHHDDPEASQAILRWTLGSYHLIEDSGEADTQATARCVGRTLLRAIEDRKRIASLHATCDPDAKNPFDGNNRPLLTRLTEGDWLVHAGEVWKIRAPL